MEQVSCLQFLWKAQCLQIIVYTLLSSIVPQLKDYKAAGHKNEEVEQKACDKSPIVFLLVLKGMIAS